MDKLYWIICEEKGVTLFGGPRFQGPDTRRGYQVPEESNSGRPVDSSTGTGLLT